MNWLKAAGVGALAALVMFILMKVGIQTGNAPFEVPPSAAFLKTLGMLDIPLPLALIAHFGYGIFWSIVLVAIFREHTDLVRGLGLAFVLWLGMMLIHSPLIGWGVFGMADTSQLPEDLQLGSPVKYIVATLILHAVYGGIIGWLNPRWITWQAGENSATGTSGT